MSDLVRVTRAARDTLDAHDISGVVVAQDDDAVVTIRTGSLTINQVQRMLSIASASLAERDDRMVH